MKHSIKCFIAGFIAFILVLGLVPSSIFADDGSDNASKASLSLLSVTAGQGSEFYFFDEEWMLDWSTIWPFTTDTPGTYSIDLTEGVFDYTCVAVNWSGIGQMNVIAEPQNSDAEVNVYATTARHESFSQYMEKITGKARLNPYETKEFNGDGKEHKYFEFVALGDDYDICAFRVEVKEDGVIKNYNVVCQGAWTEDPLSDIKSSFNITVDEQTDVSSFATEAKAIVETAKPIFKSMMDQATTVQEACRIANQFNMIVCSAKSIEDEITTLNDAVHDADTALAGITAAVNTGANDAVDEAEALDLTAFSEEDAAAVTTALADLKEVLADDTAAAEEILNAKEALEEAVYTAKINAQDAQIDQLKEDHRKDVEENERLRAQLAEITEAKENAEKKLEETEAELAEVKQFIIDDSMNKILDRTEQYLDSAKEELAKAAEELKKEAGSAAESVLKKIFAAAGDAVRSATAGLEQINGTLGKGADRVNALKEQLGDLAKAIKEGAASEAELNDLRSQLEDAEEELAKARETAADADGLSAELEALRAELAKANEKLAKATKPGKVTIRSAKAGKKKVTVKWDARTDADGYVVFRSLKKSKGFKAVKTIKKAKTVKFVDKKVKKGKKYFYKVCAYKNYDGNKLNGQFSKVLKTKKVK